MNGGDVTWQMYGTKRPIGRVFLPEMRRVKHVLIGLLCLYIVASIAVGIALAEFTLHVHRRPIGKRAEFASILHEQFHADLLDVSVSAEDNSVLRAWYAQPRKDNGSTVILLHGVTDNREGVAGYSRLFLNEGYRILLPDSRAHGESGGAIATYGLLEREDVHRWAEWARQQPQSRCIYLFGESMGAAIALQATASDPNLCAVVVESPYSTFREVGFDRFAQHSRLPLWLVRPFAEAPLDSALIYTRIRYGVDLRQSSPEYCVTSNSVPLLLIAGTADRNIQERHSKELMRIAGSHAEFWEVAGADHGGAVSVNAALFQSKVLEWYKNHPSIIGSR
jgi:alpha-beta hydrolase superfamily lysophospholipase